jgi:hypothetical protein
VRRDHPDRTYEFLMNSLKKHLARQRLQRNRTAMTHSLSSVSAPASKTKGQKDKKESKREGSVSAPAKGRGKGSNPPRPPGQGGICYQYQKTGKCTRPKCPYEHTRSARSSSGSSRSSSRGSSPGRGKDKTDVRSSPRTVTIGTEVIGF